MEFLKKFYKISANSIIESVIALCIISVCLYIAVLVYAAVFSPKTTPKFYGTHNKLDEIFFETQVQNDSIYQLENPNLNIEEENHNANLKQMKITYKDSSNSTFKKDYYIQITNE